MTRQLLTVYGRADCHLCQDMMNDLVSFRDSLDFELKFVDIDTDKQLVERYGEKVPVLLAAKQEICHYFLDKQALIEYFEQA